MKWPTVLHTEMLSEEILMLDLQLFARCYEEELTIGCLSGSTEDVPLASPCLLALYQFDTLQEKHVTLPWRFLSTCTNLSFMFGDRTVRPVYYPSY